MSRSCRLLLLPLLAAALAGCPKTGAEAPATPAAATTPGPAAPATPASTGLDAQLARYHWRLQAATDASGKRIDALFVRDDAPVQLDFKEGRVGISNTCNRIGGTYTTTGDTLAFGRMNSTMMACADAKLMALDGEVSTRLQGPLTYTLAESEPPQLRLRNAAGDVLSFAAQPTADTRFGGPGKRMFLEVAAQTQPCHHPLIPNMQCLQVREVHYDDKGLKVGAPGTFQHFYDSIEGYIHQPGTRNVLRVDRYTVQNPPADASNVAYVLDMVVESEVVSR